MHDTGVEEARKIFAKYGCLPPGGYEYGFGADDYIRELIQALVGYDRTGSFLGSYNVEIVADPKTGENIFSITNTTGWESASRIPWNVINVKPGSNSVEDMRNGKPRGYQNRTGATL